MKHYHLGINLGHDRAAALVCDGEIIVATHQERLDRKKHSVGFLHQSMGDAEQIQLPLEAIRYCLDSCNINMSDLSSIIANMPGQDYSTKILQRSLAPEWCDKITPIPSHHLAHAYSAYWPSGFDDALVMVVDASGSTENNQTESYSLYRGQGNTLSPLHSETVDAHLAGLSTLGFLYEYVTRKAAFVTQVSSSLAVPEAGKLMGLAPYGKLQHNWQQWIHPVPGSYSLDISPYDIFLEIAALEKRYDDGEGKAYLRPYLVDMAYKIQHELEQALLHIVKLAIQDTGLKKLCLAGGVALNSVANYKLYRQLGLEDIFIFPAAGDAGIAAGCALWGYSNKEKGQQRKQLRSAALGRSYSSEEAQHAAKKFGDRIKIETMADDQIVSRCADALAKGHIIARVGGGSEYGPRALGHRSILADPTFTRMKDIINARVKFREAFRPFAPVIPESDVTDVFEQEIAAPFMLLVSDIKKEYHEILPAITHHDGTGRVQTVTEEDNTYMYQLCRKMSEIRQGPAVVLNTSFNVAGQPIVETPEEAIETFLRADIDYLCLENLWISKTQVPVLNYEQHLSKVKDELLPHGLPPEQPSALDLMQQLDRALFCGETENCPWSEQELQALSSAGGRYKETSKLFPDSPFQHAVKTQLSQNILLMLDPLGQSQLINLNDSRATQSYPLEDLKWIFAVHQGQLEQLESLRTHGRLTSLEAKQKISWAQQQLDQFGLDTHDELSIAKTQDSAINPSNTTFACFENEEFQLADGLSSLRSYLIEQNYSIIAICDALNIDSLQHIDPTHLHYYNKFKLPQTELGDLVRLFLLRGELTHERMCALFGETLFSQLRDIGLLIPRGEHWASRIDLYCADELFIATDHRYMFLPEDKLGENPVMYIGMDSLGLVCTAPRSTSNKTLDLCSGSGIQALVASRYSRHVTGVDLNPRAIRFARFNAQLNGIDNARFTLGNLYEAVTRQRFDTILANPPFVPSPSASLRFRDGGKSGEEVLRRIIKEASTHLSSNGKLYIVTDLVDISTYQAKLSQWWQEGRTDTLVLHTADRDDILFSVPHSHHPFGQSYEDYNKELAKWVTNFHEADIQAVNFGYILIQNVTAARDSSYFSRTIHNPSSDIWPHVMNYFDQRTKLASLGTTPLYLELASGLHFRIEQNASDGTRQIEIVMPDQPYFSTYSVSEEIYQAMADIAATRPPAADYLNNNNKEWLENLILKGLVSLSSLETPQHSVYDTNIAIAPLRHTPSAKKEINSSKANGAPAILELATKTTPTCLSSYITQ